LEHDYQKLGAPRQDYTHAPTKAELPSSSLHVFPSGKGTLASVSFTDKDSGRPKTWFLIRDYPKIGEISNKAEEYKSLQQELSSALQWDSCIAASQLVVNRFGPQSTLLGQSRETLYRIVRFVDPDSLSSVRLTNRELNTVVSAVAPALTLNNPRSLAFGDYRGRAIKNIKLDSNAFKDDDLAGLRRFAALRELDASGCWRLTDNCLENTCLPAL
jgi:hypothetical protein